MGTTQDIRKNLKVVLDGVPWAVTEAQFVKPGKGQAFTRVTLKNMVTGRVVERTWKSGETVEVADVEERKMQYIYPEGEDFVFMDQNSGDQVTIGADKVGDYKNFLADGMDVSVTFFNGLPIGVDLPSAVVLQIISSEPGVKGDTSGGATKPATLSTGYVVNVPLFIKEGEWVKVSTETGQYQERVNK
jgi:elongation factor P